MYKEGPGADVSEIRKFGNSESSTVIEPTNLKHFCCRVQAGTAWQTSSLSDFGVVGHCKFRVHILRYYSNLGSDPQSSDKVSPN